jgi:cholesterol transport system auxiliary component
MIRRIALPLLAAFSLLFGGCAQLLTETPPQRLYRLAPDVVFRDLPAQAARWQLAVERPVAAGGLDTARIALHPSGNEINYLAGASWASRAPDMLQSLLVEAFLDSDRLPGAGRDGAALRSDYLLRIELRDFQVGFARGEPAQVQVGIAAQLIARDGRRIVGSTRLNRRGPTETGSAAAVATAFDAQLGELLGRLVGWTLECGTRAQNNQRCD